MTNSCLSLFKQNLKLELRILAHLANCKSMLDAFRAGGDFHSRTATNIYAHVREAVEEKRVLLEWHPQLGKHEPPVPLLKVRHQYNHNIYLSSNKGNYW